MAYWVEYCGDAADTLLDLQEKLTDINRRKSSLHLIQTWPHGPSRFWEFGGDLMMGTKDGAFCSNFYPACAEAGHGRRI